jgi:putative SOS response-associated peptidase YedK
MCGRYGWYHTGADLAEMMERFGVHRLPEDLANLEPRYNIAPTDPMPVLRLEDGALTAERMRWGLVPFWAKDLKIGASMINARREGITEKPAFREAVRRRRCLVPASGFYEWLKLAGGKQPMHIRRRDGRPFAFAGLWEQWRGPDGPVRTYTIVTTEPNALMAPIHNRMPVILSGEDAARWLDPEATLDALTALLEPCPPEPLEAFPVNRGVGNVAFQGRECLERAGPPPSAPFRLPL